MFESKKEKTEKRFRMRVRDLHSGKAFLVHDKNPYYDWYKKNPAFKVLKEEKYKGGEERK